MTLLKVVFTLLALVVSSGAFAQGAVDEENIATLRYDEGSDSYLATIPGVEDEQKIEATQIGYKYGVSCIWYLGYGGGRECWRYKYETGPNWPYCTAEQVRQYNAGKKNLRCYLDPMPGGRLPRTDSFGNFY